MKKVLLLMLAVTGLLFATSCSDDDNDASLSIDKEVLNFEKEGATANVGVTTDADNWSAIGSADWIQVKADGTNLVVVVAANETVYDRQGKILVVAGNANASIDVTQKGLTGAAEIIPSDVILPDSKGMDTFEVKANDQKWTAESDAEWLTVEAKQHKAELILHYDQNAEMEDRMAVVTITVGNDKTTVDVKQLGKMFFLVPYADLAKAKYDDVLAFEKSRRNILNEDRSDESALVYKTRSAEMFPNMVYFFTEDENQEIISCIISAISADAMRANLDDFKAYLVANGYAATDNEIIYENAEYGVRAEIKFYTFWGMEFADVLYKPIIEQPGDMPTFTEFPYPYMEWGVMKDKIDTYEEDKNGTYNEEQSDVDNPNYPQDMLVYDRDGSDEGKTANSIYFVTREGEEEPGLGESGLLMKDISRVFYIAAGEAHLTKEFKQLCADEGFKYKGASSNGFHIFHHPEKKVNVVVGHKNYKGFGEVVHLAAFPKEEETDSLQILKKESADNNKVIKVSDYIR